MRVWQDLLALCGLALFWLLVNCATVVLRIRAPHCARAALPPPPPRRSSAVELVAGEAPPARSAAEVARPLDDPKSGTV